MVDIPKRPKYEHTERNRNIALMHAMYHCLKGLVSNAKGMVEEMIKKVLDGKHDLDSNDNTTPEGIGNMVGKKIPDITNSNGMNSLGDFRGKIRYNRKPFAPTIKHKLVNSPYNIKLRDPSRWQPALVKIPNGYRYVAQTFVTPQLRLVEPIMTKNLSEYYVKPHGRVNPWSRCYKETTDEVINELAIITEGKKVAGELFNDKLALSGYTILHLAMTNKYSQLQAAALGLGAYFGIHDAMIIVWREKARYDAVRPFSAVRHLYKNEAIKGYAGPEQGIVDDLPGSEWTSYLEVADHPEYPSATATICGVLGDFAKLFTKTENARKLRYPMKKGSSLREPGITPTENTYLEYDSWDQFSEECAMSRFWTGVHFKDACTEGLRLGREFGLMSHQKIMYHLGETNEQ